MSESNSGDPHAWYVSATIAAAQNGDYDAAREALRLFVVAVTCELYQAKAPETELLTHVADCMSRYLVEGANLELALGLKRPRQRPKDAEGNVGLSMARAAAVELLMRHAFGKTEAVEAVEIATGVNRRTIMRDCKGWVRDSLSERHLRYIALPVTRSPDFPPLHSE